jgi:hypothetical protein
VIPDDKRVQGDGQSLVPPAPSYLAQAAFGCGIRARDNMIRTLIRTRNDSETEMSDRTRTSSPPRLALTPKHVGPELRWVRRGRLKFVAVSEIEDWLRRNGALTLDQP